jgi:hypothetical protein
MLASHVAISARTLAVAALTLASTVAWATEPVEPDAPVVAAPPPAADTAGSFLHAGEFRNNAYTTQRGDVVLHPLLKTHIGLAKGLDVKFPILGQIAGPRASVELGLVQGDAFALSIEPEAGASWSGGSFHGNAVARTTIGVGEHRFNLSAGGGYTHATITTIDADGNETTSSLDFALIPVNLGFDLVATDRTTVRFVANTDVGAILATDVKAGLVGFNWNHAAGDKFRVSAGVAAYVGENPITDLLDSIGIEGGPDLATLPLPTLELWWTI